MHIFFSLFMFSGKANFQGGETIIMDKSRFKNDNRAHPDLVIEHMVSEMEKQIEAMTGKRIKLIAQEIKKPIL